MLAINAERFLSSLTHLAELGRVSTEKGGGLDRRPFSSSERAARAFFRQRAMDVGLDVVTDGAANLSARLVAADAGAKTILFGSHLDTVPHGGAYDGALGVMAGLEVLCRLHEEGVRTVYHLEAIAFTDEEGRLGDLTGSQIAMGAYSRAQITRFLQNAEEYADDLAAMRAEVPGALTPESLLAAKRDPHKIAAFVELHVEQGPQLEHAGATIGVVDAIFGRRSYEVTFSGRSDHAGTTPLLLRADALVASARFISGAHDLVRRRFPHSVLTCGNVTVRPGVYNVVPNWAQILLEFRAGSVAELQGIDENVRVLLDEIATAPELTYSMVRTSQLEPRAMDENVQKMIRQAAEELDYSQMTFSSGALHDAHSLAPYIPTGMIFVPSIGGRSHCPDEETDSADLVAGANVLLNTIQTMSSMETLC